MCVLFVHRISESMMNAKHCRIYFVRDERHATSFGSEGALSFGYGIDGISTHKKKTGIKKIMCHEHEDMHDDKQPVLEIDRAKEREDRAKEREGGERSTQKQETNEERQGPALRGTPPPHLTRT